MASRTEQLLKLAVEIVPNRLYFVALNSKPTSEASVIRDADGNNRQIHYFSIDNELVYWNFFLDFGPLNLAQLYRFCTKMNQKLMAFADHIICFYSGINPAKRANAVCLICSWQVLYLKRSPEDAFNGFRLTTPSACSGTTTTTSSADPVSAKRKADAGASGARNGVSNPPLISRSNPTSSALPPFHDASPCACSYDLTVLDCLRGLAKARRYNFFDFENFDLDEYEHFEQVENGDLNWIIYGKILAFAGPSYNRRVSPEGYCTLAPSDYIPYFKKRNVGLVVRLNRKAYNEEDFLNAGIQHLEQFYTDGSCPPRTVLDRVIERLDAVPANEAFAVHCKAGLGRTGTCIGAWIMKHYRFTASEVIAWMRICRPGMVIGPQQHFLKEIESRMWKLGTLEESCNVGTNTCGSFRLDCLSTTKVSAVGQEVEALPTSAKVTPDPEAGFGRAGQADSLLSARRRRAGTTTANTPKTKF